MAHLLGAESLHLEFPTKVVFEDVTIGIDEGDRIGIVGRNGDGKSTLLKLLAGRIQPDSGRVTVRGGVRIGMLDQGDTLDPDLTVGHAIVGDLDEHEWAGDPKVRDVIRGLAGDLDWHATIGGLSGGQQRRVALAQLLVGDDDVIFLDEPTNHLDVEGIAWLAEHLNNRWPRGAGGLVVVTHDRWFLDAVCTGTWEVHDRILEPFDGGYAAYMLQRVERDRQAAVVEQKRQNLMRKELAWLRRGAPARTAKPKFRIEAANQLIEDVPPVRNPIELQKMAVARLGKDVVDLLDVGVTYAAPEPSVSGPSVTGPSVTGPSVPELSVAEPVEGTGAADAASVRQAQGPAGVEVLRDITWHIAPGERTGILGINGAGKSTLLQLVAGELEPTSGRVKTGKTVKVATLSQRLTEFDDHADDRVREVIGRMRTSYTAGGTEMTPSQMLERLGFTSAQLQTPVKDLSGGQRRRLQFLLILLGEPNVLILDEPTNDLDTDMLAAMEDLLDSWPGTLLVVSHDRFLLERVTDQQYAVWDKGLRHLPGGVDEYLALRKRAQDARDRAGVTGTSDATSPLGADSASRSTEPSSNATASTAVTAAAPTLSGAERRAAEKEVASIQRRLDKLAGEVASVDGELAAHDQSDFEALATLGGKRQQLVDATDELEHRWLELSEQLEG